MPQTSMNFKQLKSFHAVAMEGSFTQAAKALGVGQPSITTHVKALEERFGVELFSRHGHHVELTELGKSLLANTLETLQREESRVPLRVDMLQSFAVKWLVPRLGHFHEEHPDIDVWISTHDEPIDFASHDMDVAIRLGGGSYPGLHSTLLLREQVFPVCSPRFLDEQGTPASPSDLLELPLLLRMGDPAHPNWEDWFAVAGVTVAMPNEGPRFPDTNMALQAAMDGQGVALARSAHVGDDLKAGRLVKLFHLPYPSSVAYYLVCPSGREDKPKIAAFRQWLLREAAAAQAEYDELAPPEPAG